MNGVFEFIIYPFLFLALFFEVFAILTFFDKDARRRRSKTLERDFPSVSILVPCYNEEKTLQGTIDSLLALEYPSDKLHFVLINDGSTDNTASIMDAYALHPRFTIVHKENGGKHTALNKGLEVVTTEFVGCLDADSFVTPLALQHIMSNFEDEKTGAVTASMSVFAPKTVLERMQEAEYLFGITLRHTLASVNGLYVTPGPFTIFRRKIFTELGNFKPAHQTEDMEIAMRLQRAGWKIGNAPKASVYTKAPTTIPSLIKQRVRWTSGFLRNAYDYRDLIGNMSAGVLGLMILPMAVLSIFSGIGLFALSTYRFLDWSYTSIMHTLEVPLSFTFSARSFDWFYIPVNTITLISLLALIIVFIFIATGARISEKKSRFGLAMIWYFFLYTLIATMWRTKAVYDVLTGVRRSWR